MDEEFFGYLLCVRGSVRSYFGNLLSVSAPHSIEGGLNLPSGHSGRSCFGFSLYDWAICSPETETRCKEWVQLLRHFGYFLSIGILA